MRFTLKHFDSSLITFSANEASANPDYKILEVHESKKKFFPLDLEVSEKGIEKWLSHRSVPKNRAYVDAFLAKCGLSLNRRLNIIYVSKGLSLTDCFWVVPEDFSGKFSDYNLYENRFTKMLSYIAFTGYGSSIRSQFFSSPEFTTNGMLPKCWRRIKGEVFLYKGGSQGASNTGFEPYSEFLAWQIADALNIKAVPYGLSKWKNILCSTCKIFTSKEFSFMPVGNLVDGGGFAAVKDFYTSLGKNFENELNKMIIFDAIIKNTDRHFGNFGFLVDNKKNQIVATAPLFDHGNSLYNMAALDDFDSVEKLSGYDKTLQPRVYDDFAEAAKSVLSDEMRTQLRSLLAFSFKRHTKYNLSASRLEAIQSQVRKNVQELLLNL